MWVVGLLLHINIKIALLMSENLSKLSLRQNQILIKENKVNHAQY